MDIYEKCKMGVKRLSILKPKGQLRMDNLLEKTEGAIKNG
jgi:hypothetical protein